MEAIVVDTESTARQCIQYLKDQVIDKIGFFALHLNEA
jgi:chromosome segregation ATPase